MATAKLPIWNRCWRGSAFMGALFAALLVVSASPAQADNKKAEDRSALLPSEVTRPAKADADKAEAALKKYNTDERAVLNVIRFLVNNADDNRRFPGWRHPPSFPGLGKTPLEGKTRRLPPWALLRLAALIRSGYPPTNELMKEFNAYVSSSPPTHSWTEISADLLVLKALNLRSKGDYKKLSAWVDDRGKRLAGAAPWTAVEPKGALTFDALHEVFHEALSRRLVQDMDLRKKLPKEWDGPVAKVGELVDSSSAGMAALLVDQHRKHVNPSSASILPALILALAADDPDQGGRRASANRESLKKLLLVLQSQTKNTLPSAPYEGDMTPFALLLPDDFLPTELRPAAKNVPAFALPRQEPYYARPSVRNSDFAALLDWNNSTSDLPDVPHYAQAHDHDLAEAVAASLALIGNFGGFFAETNKPLKLDEKDVTDLLIALTTQELAKVPDSFEARVSRAITISAEWLKRQQLPDGRFPGQWGTHLGGQAFALLALLDADVPRDDPVIVKGINAMRSMSPGNQITYSAGIVLMLLQKYYEKEQEAAGMLKAKTRQDYDRAAAQVWKALKNDDRQWVTKLTEQITRNSQGYGWGYGGASAKGGGAGVHGAAWSDNSNAQYGVLGLKAASLLGAKYDREIMKKEAERWLKTWIEDSSMPEITVVFDEGDEAKPIRGRTDAPRRTAVRGKTRPGAWPYQGYMDGKQYGPTVQMTAAGVASLVICRDELKIGEMLDDEMSRTISLRIAAGLHWIGERSSYKLPYSRGQWHDVHNDGHGMMYNMYAIERAGVLAQERYMAELDWYREGAEILLEGQTNDGRWPAFADEDTPYTINTCMAILFLKRAAIPTHHKRRPVITPHGGG